MRSDRLLTIFWRGVAVAACILVLWLGIKYVLPLFLPFLLALIIARLENPLIELVTAKTGLRRGPAAALCTTGILAAAGALLWLIIRTAAGQVQVFLEKLPDLLAGLGRLLEGAGNWSGKLVAAAPHNIKELVAGLLEGLESSLAAAGPELSKQGGAGAAGLAAGIPGFLFSAAAMLIAVYFIGADYRGVTGALMRAMPAPLRGWVRKIKTFFSESFFRWLRAQLILMLITFGELFVGFIILGVDLAFLAAAVIAVVDMLPVFGTGTVVIPWILYAFFSGDAGLGTGLLILYVIVTVVRNIVEPRLVGAQMGLHPLAALMSMYVGWRLFGLWGLILAPMAAMTLKRLDLADTLRRWLAREKGPEETQDA